MHETTASKVMLLHYGTRSGWRRVLESRYSGRKVWGERREGEEGTKAKYTTSGEYSNQIRNMPPVQTETGRRGYIRYMM